LSAADLLIRAQAAGIELVPRGGKLKVRAAQRPPDELLAALRAHKAELLQLLMPRRHAYTFRLHGGDGGVYITDTPDPGSAFAELERTYGGRLALVWKS
jgi:hypothetical protein